ncbi:MAG: methylaspartate mutase subunit S [Chloroflexota bacterium]
MAEKATIVTGTVGQDSHVIGIKLLSRYLMEQGYKVIELGGLTPAEEFIKVAQETAADAILISSLYGMAEFDLAGFKEKCTESGLEDVLLYLGGNLAVGRHSFEDDERKFKAMGFDRVYPPEIDMAIIVSDLKNDLKAKSQV